MVNLVLDPRWQAGHESIYFANFIFFDSALRYFQDSQK